MLNSVAGMRRNIHWINLLLLGWVLVAPRIANAQFAFEVTINSPQTGDAIQGVIPIIGSAAVDGFNSYQLVFSHRDDPTETWFVIESSDVPINNGILGEWDTSNITDGTYQVRLNVIREEEEPIVVLVEGLRVRNYTPIETDTPGPTRTESPDETAAPSKTPMSVTPTELPLNQAELTQREIRGSITIGVVGSLFIFIFLGLYAVIKRRERI